MTIKTHFFGKDCLIKRDLKDRNMLEAKLADAGFAHNNILLLNQVHGNEVIVIDDVKKIYGNQDLPKLDAIVTNLKNITIGIITADCCPILFFDEEKNIIGAAHAGWQGAKKGVIKSTIDAMKKLGAKNIKAKIGPMIQQDSYQVSQEFYDDFLSEDLMNKEFFINDAEASKYKFDLSSYVEKKIKLEGITAIENPRIDTYKNEATLFSFRRSTHKKEEDCGRNVSVTVIN